MTEQEIKEAMQQLLELRDHSCFDHGFLDDKDKYYVCCGEPDYRLHKENCERVKCVDGIIGFISQYLNLKGWPEEIKPTHFQGNDYLNPVAESFNATLRLCKLAALKEKNEIETKRTGGEILFMDLGHRLIKRILEFSPDEHDIELNLIKIIGKAKQLELINGKEKE